MLYVFLGGSRPLESFQLGFIARVGGGLPYKNDGGCSSYLLGVKICQLVPLRVLSYKNDRR